MTLAILAVLLLGLCGALGIGLLIAAVALAGGGGETDELDDEWLVSLRGLDG